MDATARLPIIYVRGFAGGDAEIEQATEDPFQGFNSGSTYVRAGVEGDILFYQFESPLLRLMTDHDYRLFVHGGQVAWLKAQPDGGVDPSTVWIHRFYDQASGARGEQKPFRMEEAAQALLDLIDLVRAKTGAPRVSLVAHSMGGLICRCVIQKLIPDRGEVATDRVDRLFTYATPHGGIRFDIGSGLLEKLRDITGVAGADVFGPDRMWEYLNTAGVGPRPDDWRAQDLPDAVFPLSRVFTLVGTDHEDYTAAHGLSAWAVGPKSDGLVQTESAYIPGANFAFVHRSHSGRYGIVNSEAGYQNLRRFLFGDLVVDADLAGLRLPGLSRERSWQADVEVSIRGQKILMHEQTARHLCPVVLRPPEEGADRPYPLVTTFLITDSSVRPPDHEESRYVLHVRIFSLRERRDVGRIFDFAEHQEQVADFEDALVVDMDVRGGRLVAWATWASDITTTLEDHHPEGDPLHDERPDRQGYWQTHVPLPRGGGFLGPDAAVRLTARPRVTGSDAG
ncbi:hypothetical protein V6N00_00825 [Tersicoccus sp. MR15.9]|uniref:alpha/beta hydrolase n=1 Tax=Tersicoccus mangrovi TaxID=3121635 RepID=UPI002FE69FEE